MASYGEYFSTDSDRPQQKTDNHVLDGKRQIRLFPFPHVREERQGGKGEEEESAFYLEDILSEFSFESHKIFGRIVLSVVSPFPISQQEIFLLLGLSEETDF